MLHERSGWCHRLTRLRRLLRVQVRRTDGWFTFSRGLHDTTVASAFERLPIGRPVPAVQRRIE